MSETEGSDQSLQDRRPRVLERAYNPLTTRELLDLFPTATQCYALIRQLVAGKELFDCGSLKLNPTGRPEHVYSTWKIAPQKVSHEFTTSEIVRYLGFAALREPDVDRRLRPDAEILGQRKVYLEMDKATMNLKDVHRRLSPYSEQENPVVVVTTTARRMEGIRATTDGAGLDDVLFLGTLRTLFDTGLVEDRFGEPLSLKNLLNKCSHV